MSQKKIAALQKGLEILSCFNNEDNELTARKLADRVGLPHSTIYRYLETLVDAGFLMRNSKDKHYRVGFMLAQLGDVAGSPTDFVEGVVFYMEQLLEALDETILFTVRRGFHGVCLVKKESRQLIKLSLEVGTSLPLYAGAASKVLLAFQEPDFIEQYLEEARMEPLTPYTPVFREAIEAQLETIRRQGYYIADQEVNLGVTAIAAPVFKNDMSVVGSLTVAGPKERINAKTISVVDMLQEAVAKASNFFGGGLQSKPLAQKRP